MSVQHLLILLVDVEVAAALLRSWRLLAGQSDVSEALHVWIDA